MKYTSGRFGGLILSLTIFVSVDSLAQGTKDSIEMQIKKINTECANINSDTSNFRIERKDITAQSSEGGILEKYYDGKTLRKAHLTMFGETGKLTSDYYFLNRELILVHDEEVRYQSPIYMGKVEIKSREESKFYFKDQRLIRWIDNENKIVERELYWEKEDEILERLKTIK